MSLEQHVDLDLQRENADLRRQLLEATETLEAIRRGAVDALVIQAGESGRIYALEGSERPYRLFVEGMQQAAVTLAPDGLILFCNRRLGEMLQQPGRMAGLPFEAAVAPDSRADWRELLERARLALASGEITLQGQSGLQVPAWVTVHTVEDSGGTTFGVVVADLTDRKHQDRLAQQAQGEAALREANRRKDEFLATLAHELRNPLAPIRNAAHILGLRGTDDPDLKQLHELIGRQAAHMARLVDDLLDVSRIERGKIELRMEPLDLRTAILQAVETCRPLVEGRGHRVELELPGEPLDVEGDPARLTQMVSNLLNNACKFTLPGGEIRITAGREGPMAVMAIRDTGVGLAPEAMAQIFDLFYQVGRNLERQEQGLGIGLTLAGRLAQFHGGTLTAASEGLGKGSEFTLRLPALAPSPARLPEAPLAPFRAAPERPKHVLVIDDNENVLATVKMLLEALGYQVSTAATGEAGVQRALALRPDAALVDLGLPGLNGLQVAERLRAELGGAIRLVALTGYSRESDIAAALMAGFDRHLVKSGDPNTLLRAMEEILR